MLRFRSAKFKKKKGLLLVTLPVKKLSKEEIKKIQKYQRDQEGKSESIKKERVVEDSEIPTITKNPQVAVIC